MPGWPVRGSSSCKVCVAFWRLSWYICGMNKICKKCGEEKPIEAFRFFKGYVRGECRDCEAKIRKEHYASDPTRFSAAARKWCKENPEQRNATKRAWYARNKEHQKGIVLRRTYGITLEEYQTRLVAQEGRCAICKEATTGACGRALHVDHCHATGKVRGLLCGKCNTLLGFVNDRLEILEAAKNYLLSQ